MIHAPIRYACYTESPLVTLEQYQAWVASLYSHKYSRISYYFLNHDLKIHRSHCFAFYTIISSTCVRLEDDSEGNFFLKNLKENDYIILADYNYNAMIAQVKLINSRDLNQLDTTNEAAVERGRRGLNRGMARAKTIITPEQQERSEIARLGGLKGGIARANSLTKEQRSEIARLGGKNRWKKHTLS